MVPQLDTSPPACSKTGAKDARKLDSSAVERTGQQYPHRKHYPLLPTAACRLAALSTPTNNAKHYQKMNLVVG
jgi:hypothetical protein